MKKYLLIMIFLVFAGFSIFYIVKQSEAEKTTKYQPRLIDYGFLQSYKKQETIKIIYSQDGEKYLSCNYLVNSKRSCLKTNLPENSNINAESSLSQKSPSGKYLITFADKAYLYLADDFEKPIKVFDLPNEKISKLDTKTSSIRFIAWNGQEDTIAFSTHNLVFLLNIDNSEIKLIYKNPSQYQAVSSRSRTIALKFSSKDNYLFFIKYPEDDGEQKSVLNKLNLKTMEYDSVFKLENIYLY
jgi:hypothetical protein